MVVVSLCRSCDGGEGGEEDLFEKENEGEGRREEGRRSCL